MLFHKHFDSMTTAKILINPKYIWQQINEKMTDIFYHREIELEFVWGHVISSRSKYL